MFLVYTMDNCGYCSKAIDYITNYLKEEVTVKNISEYKEELLAILPNVTTVPQIFYRGKYVGDCEDLLRDF